MLFGFRGIRTFQVILAVIALVCAIAAVFSAKAYSDDDEVLMLLPAILLGLVFFWAFITAIRAPTSFVAIDYTSGRSRIRFAGFIDTVIANGDVTGARLVRRSWLGGLGVRLGPGGTVALASAWGEVAEIDLRTPVRVWLVPKLIPLQAKKLQLSVRNPAKLVEGFTRKGPPPAPQPAASPTSKPTRKMRRGGPRTR